MKQMLLILSVFVFSSSFGQVDNYDLLTNNIETSNIKTITKFRESKKFPNGEKKFKLEFNKEGQLVSIEEYDYPMGPDNPIVMRQEIKYDQEGKKVATHIKAPGGSTAVDTLIYDNQDNLVEKQRIANGQVVRTWNYSDTKEDDEEQKEFDDDGNLIKITESADNYTTYNYNSNGNLTQELEFQDGEEHTKYTFTYDKNGLLTNMETYLLYIRDGTNAPLNYYFEYEEFK
jgi:YD repeat-containing protein